MIDLHCHYLPAVDDGPQSLPEALEMARLAVLDGISLAVLTPHVHPGRYGNVRSSIETNVDAFRKALASENIPLRVLAGGEVRVSPEILDLVLDGEIPFVGTHRGLKVCLFEFPHQILPVGSDRFLAKMIDLRILPLIAHPERNKTVMHDPERMRPFVEMGCLLQLTAASIIGEFGDGAAKAADYFLKSDWASIVASDAHNPQHRPPRMSKAWEHIRNKFGESRANLLLRDRPAQIVGSQV